MNFRQYDKQEVKIDKKMAERKRKEIRNFKKKFLKEGRSKFKKKKKIQRLF